LKKYLIARTNLKKLEKFEIHELLIFPNIENKKMSTIRDMTTEMTLYLEPGILKDEYKHLVIYGQTFDKEFTRRMFAILSSIEWIAKRLSKYPIYFQEFYSTSASNPDFEALEYHIHSYLEDTETFYNKIRNYLGVVKNVCNKDKGKQGQDRVRVIVSILETISNIFKQVSKIRGDHRHGEFRHLDSNVVDAERFETIITGRHPLSDQFTPYTIEHFTTLRSKSIGDGKAHWTSIAEKNRENIDGIVEMVMLDTKEILYEIIGITPITPLSTYDDKVSK
jgi:hypothetical protein